MPDLDLERFHRETADIVAQLQRDSLAELRELEANDPDKRFTVLASPGAMTANQVLIVVSGIPERTGVWSYTLLQQGRPEDTSMRPYFEMAKKIKCGLVALNPHGHGRKGAQAEYHRQLEEILGRMLDGNRQTSIAILCFSAGGPMTVSLLNQNGALAAKIETLIMIDTPPPPLLKKSIVPQVNALVSRSVLFGLTDPKGRLSMWAKATASVLGIPTRAIHAELHGELPNLLCPDVQRILTAGEPGTP